MSGIYRVASLLEILLSVTSGFSYLNRARPPSLAEIGKGGELPYCQVNRRRQIAEIKEVHQRLAFDVQGVERTVGCQSCMSFKSTT